MQLMIDSAAPVTLPRTDAGRRETGLAHCRVRLPERDHRDSRSGPRRVHQQVRTTGGRRTPYGGQLSGQPRGRFMITVPLHLISPRRTGQ